MLAHLLRRNFCFESSISFRFASYLLRPSLYPTTPPPSSLHIFRKTSFFIPCQSIFPFFKGSTWAVLQKEDVWCGRTRCGSWWEKTRCPGQLVLEDRTISPASPDSHICHMSSAWTCSHLWGDQGPGGEGPICGRWSLTWRLHEGGSFGQQRAQTDLLEGFLKGLDCSPPVHTSPGVPQLRLCWATLHRSPRSEALLQAADAAGEGGGTQPQRLMRGTPSAARSCGTSPQHHHFQSHVP